MSMIHCKSTARVWTDFHCVLCKVKDFSNSAYMLKFLDDSRLRSGNNREARWPWPNLTLILLTWRIWWAPNNASRWQMGFNSAFKGLRHYPTICLDGLMKVINNLTHYCVLDETHLKLPVQQSEANLLSCLGSYLFK